ncbi:MAG: methyltransferase domain-containing protein [Dehalococcoidia bacterium]
MVFDEARRDAFAGRLFSAGIASLELMDVYLGERLGLYAALQASGPLTPAGLAVQAGIHERYAREWLEQQAVAGVLDVEGEADGDGTRFSLPAEHAEPLLDRRSMNYTVALGRFLPAVGGQMDAIVEAYRTGGGVPWSAYGEDVLTAQADFNRPMFEQLLVQEWLPQLPEVYARLQQTDARIADIACGGGWSSIAMARGLPGATVDGFDYDGPSVALATRNAGDAGLADRVRIHQVDVSEPGLQGQYDLVTIFEALHDMSRPVEALAGARGLLRDGGVVLVMDERAEPSFSAPAGEVERFLYSISTVVCLVNSMAEQPSAALGTVLRESTVRHCAEEAGFATVDVLPIEHELFRFYALRP